MIPLLIDAAKVMDDLYWQQTYGNREVSAGRISRSRHAALRGDQLRPVGPAGRQPAVRPRRRRKPPGANFYPADMTKDQFEAAASASPDVSKQLKSLLYAGDAAREGGGLVAVPYHEAFAAPTESRRGQAARGGRSWPRTPACASTCNLRAQALLTDDYRASDMAWLDMKTNTVDVVIGPIETYEDQLFGYKASYEAYVLVKDKEWSRRLARYAELLPGLQTGPACRRSPTSARSRARIPI